MIHVYPGPFQQGYTAEYGLWLYWDECPLLAVAGALEAAADPVEAERRLAEETAKCMEGAK